MQSRSITPRLSGITSSPFTSRAHDLSILENTLCAFSLILKEHNGSYERDSWQPETTIADLVQATGGPSLPVDEPLYCDNRPVIGLLHPGGGQADGRCAPSLGRRLLLPFPGAGLERVLEWWFNGYPAAPYPLFASSGGGSFPVRRHCAAHGERVVGAPALAGGS